MSPFGKAEARFEPVAGQARIPQQILSWIACDRCSLDEVCRRLQKAGEVTATGKRIWSRQAAWHIIQNPAYQGRAAYGKTHMMPRGKKAARLQQRADAQRVSGNGRVARGVGSSEESREVGTRL
jgi:hypothetical protein